MKNHMGRSVGIVWHASHVNHRVTKNHPESFARLKAILQGLREAKLLDEKNEYIIHQKQTNALALCHSFNYCRLVEEFCSQLGDENIETLPTGDVEVSRDSYKVALDAISTFLLGIDLVVSGEQESAFCIVRPPGHHAEPEKGMGFCLFSTAAIGAHYLVKKHGMQRVAIVDWDVHHGNGTQACCMGKKEFLYISTHQAGIYPGTGQYSQDNCLNFPILGGVGSRDRLIATFQSKVIPALESFQPTFILVSCGFDAHLLDPLGGMDLKSEDFATLTWLINQVVDKTAQGRVVSVLEGGYNLQAIQESAVAHVRALNRISAISV